MIGLSERENIGFGEVSSKCCEISGLKIPRK
jgi:hypothetical protein